MFGKKKKHPFDAGIPENEYLATYQANQLERLEKKVDKLVSENEFLRAELHRQIDEEKQLIRRFMKSSIDANESPFGQSISSESKED